MSLTLHLKEYFGNTQTRVVKRYEGKISDHVNSILTEVLPDTREHLILMRHHWSITSSVMIGNHSMLYMVGFKVRTITGCRWSWWDSYSSRPEMGFTLSLLIISLVVVNL